MTFNNKTIKTVLSIAFLIGLFCFCEWFAFRNIIFNNNLFGNLGDGRLTLLLTEHWWRFVTGKEGVGELSIFYPTKHILGYTDIFLGFGIIHSFFRLCGLDMYLAYKLTLFIIHIFGTTTMYILLRKTLKNSYVLSIVGTLIFVYANLFLISIHTQLFSIMFLPLLLILFINFLRNFKTNRSSRNIYAIIFILWFALIAYTSWYTAYFTFLFSLIFIIIYLINLKIHHIKIISALRKYISILRFDLLLYSIVILVTLIPFLYIYISALSTAAGGIGDFSIYTIEFLDLINVGENNIFFGWAIKLLNLSNRPFSTPEATVGIAIFTIVVFIASLYIYTKTKQKGSYKSILLGTTYITIFISIFSIIRLSSNGVAPLWFVFYYTIPGTIGIRAVSRFLIWLMFPISIISIVVLNKKILLIKTNMPKSKESKSLCLSASVFLICFAYFSNANFFGVNGNWNKDNQISFINEVTPPPSDVQVFYITDNESHKSLSVYQLDAMEIAYHFSIKTINGYSGLYPKNWDLYDIFHPDYESNVSKWVKINRINDVYSYNESTNSWTKTNFN